MYRILGINESGQRKLIKKEALEIAYDWNTDKTTDTEWPDSDLYTGLNGSYFLNNTTYVPDSSWSNRIATTSWKYGEFKKNGASASEVATAELGFSDSVNAKIGLLYIHDYAYTFSEGKNCSETGLCKPSWIYLLNSAEWTMSRADIYAAWRVYSNGDVSYTGMTNTYSMRPVFFLSSSEVIALGEGTIDIPYTLA